MKIELDNLNIEDRDLLTQIRLSTYINKENIKTKINTTTKL